jgi:6,7-dimethyl-8-ribityllumazine synthase
MASSAESKSLLQYNNLQFDTELQVVIVYTEWNEAILSELKAGAMRILEQFPSIKISLVQVPGCIEISNAVYRMVHAKQADAVIALGCVIRGETPHFDYVCQSVTQGITLLNASQPIPIIFGILTVNQESEAWDRLGGKHGHKGEEAAIAALKMIQLPIINSKKS